MSVVATITEYFDTNGHEEPTRRRIVTGDALRALIHTQGQAITEVERELELPAGELTLLCNGHNGASLRASLSAALKHLGLAPLADGASLDSPDLLPAIIISAAGDMGFEVALKKCHTTPYVFLETVSGLRTSGDEFSIRAEHILKHLLAVDVNRTQEERAMADLEDLFEKVTGGRYRDNDQDLIFAEMTTEERQGFEKKLLHAIRSDAH